MEYRKSMVLICLQTMLSGLLLLLSGGIYAQTLDCDRQCLRTMMQGYMQAVVAGDPDAVAIMPG